MKYTRAQIRSMSKQQYVQTMCDELKTAGFQEIFNGELIDYVPTEYVFGGSIKDNEVAVLHLKSIGILNNGKCPMCCSHEDDVLYQLLTSNGINFHVCKQCYKQHSRQERAKRGCRCCLVIIVITAAITAAITYGIMKIVDIL